ncbi:MAG: lysophospholipid acyltransferase family protein [Candidatus Kapabacteria bacterium]|nr:lysophospholipid acyltransferase family protein [Ignavibacteriota bacterium]MCW5884977.1 lysophospholipid acyltransferase family protein [Candidatus Kapabacteria bacterium]
MIYADHKKWADLVFKQYIYKLLKKSFYSISVIGEVPEVPLDAPLILAPNHSTWWDGFFVYLINRKYFDRKFFIMILEEQLEKYKFFTKLGGFSINKSSPKSIVKSLKYSAEILENYPHSVTTIFPQGELLPNFIKPLNFNRGIEKIVQYYGKKTYILPLSMRIEYLKEEKPSVFFKFGKLVEVIQNDDGLTNKLKHEVESGLETIGKKIIAGEFGNIIMHGKISVSDKSKKAFNIIKKS